MAMTANDRLIVLSPSGASARTLGNRHDVPRDLSSTRWGDHPDGSTPGSLVARFEFLLWCVDQQLSGNDRAEVVVRLRELIDMRQPVK
jgi:hypothetical protein